MKTGAKILSFFLMLFMLTAIFPAAVFASDGDFTITIKNGQSGHTYEAYQIFSGRLSGGVLSDIAWGSGISEAGKSALKTKYGADSAQGVAAAVVKSGNASEFASVAGAAGNLSGSHSDSAPAGTGIYKIQNLAAGYYLIKDKDNSLSGSGAYTRFIMQVSENVTITPKFSVPVMEKKVMDINDSADAEISDNTWQDSADHDIGDKVPFQLKATLGSTVTDYAVYKIVFHDTLSEGLSFEKESLKVTIDGNPVTEGYTAEESNGNLTVSFSNVKEQGASNSSVIIINYTAELNEKAVIGSAGNPNTAYLEYSNNPNSSSGTGTTPPDKVTVFTYQLRINKTDKDSHPLKGAGFTLYKSEASLSGSDKWRAVGSELKGSSMTSFEWKGLDDGEYRLVETTTPPGFSTASPIEFTISAVHDEKGENPRLTVLEADAGFSVSGEIISADIVNKTGSSLPETGGTGAGIFYIFGGIMTAGSLSLLIRRRISVKK